MVQEKFDHVRARQDCMQMNENSLAPPLTLNMPFEQSKKQLEAKQI